MKNVLIVDTETTGVDHDTDQVIEVGAILYSVEHATMLQAFSSLIYAKENPAESINRIPAAALRASSETAEGVWTIVGALAQVADAYLAHNADFDRAFFPARMAERLPWICTKRDIQWPKATRPELSLVPLALEHDLGVSVAHRALADCDLIARLLTRCAELGHDLEAMLRRGLRPKVTLMACVSYEDREKAKAAGFHWNAGRKQWLRRMVEEDAVELGFPVRIVETEERAA